MRRWRSIIILAVVLALLIGVYIFLNNRPDNEDAEKENTMIELYRMDSNSMERMTLDTGDQLLEFQKDEEEWVLVKPYSVELNQDNVNNLAGTLSVLFANIKVAEEADDLSTFGLDKPVAKAEAFFEDGSSTGVLLGSRAPTGFYYLMVEGDPAVYTVTSNHGRNLSYSMSDFRKQSFDAINAETFNYLLMERDDMDTVEIVDDPEAAQQDIRFFLGSLRLVQPYREVLGLNAQALNEFIEQISKLSVLEFIDDHPEDLSLYGLDQPSTHIVIRDDQTELELFFGSEHDENSIYFKTDGSDSVYTVEKEQVSFIDTPAFDFAEKLAFVVNIDNVEKIRVEADGVDTLLELKRTVKSAQQEGEEDETITTYFKDGTEVEEDDFKQYYQSLIGLSVDAEMVQQVEGEPDVRTTFFVKDVDQPLVMEYIPHDNDFYAVVKDGGESEFLIGRMSVDNMLQELDSLGN